MSSNIDANDSAAHSEVIHWKYPLAKRKHAFNINEDPFLNHLSRSNETPKMYKIVSSGRLHRPILKVHQLPLNDDPSPNPSLSRAIKHYACPSCPFTTIKVKFFCDHINLHSCALSIDLKKCTFYKIPEGHAACQDQFPQVLLKPLLPLNSHSDVSTEGEEDQQHLALMAPTDKELSKSNNNYGYLEVEAEEVKYIKVEAKNLNQNIIKCRICSYTTIKKDHLNRHMKSHLRLKTFSCSKCSYGTHRKDHFQRHKFVHSKNNCAKCPHCSFTSEKSTLLLYHIRRHAKTDRFSCTECNFSSMSGKDFRLHLRSCNAKFFLCSMCDYLSQKKYKLQQHLKIHYKNAVAPAKSK